jgi:hypothetical protein
MMLFHRACSPAIAVGVLLSTPAVAVCRLDDIKIRQADWHPDMQPYVKVVGEILNTCSEPTGVQLQFTFRDGDGKVIEVQEMWPASTRNIAPNASYPFSFPLAITGRPNTMEAKVIEVKRW